MDRAVQSPEKMNARQKLLLNRLLAADQSLSVEEMADMFRVSTRTVQRDLKAIRAHVDRFRLHIENDRDHAIMIAGEEEDKDRLRQYLSEQVVRMFTPEDRQEGIVIDLLLAREPVKTFALGRKYEVTESTISQDLNKVEEELKPYGLAVVRKPGLGVYVSGTEQQIRAVFSDVLHRQISMEKWLELFSLSSPRTKQADRFVDREHPLAELVDVHQLIQIEQAVGRVLKQELVPNFSDRHYVNLVIHIAIAVQRLASGEPIRYNEEIIEQYQQLQEYSLARKIADSIQDHLQVRLPELEVTYIALHLYGAQIDPEQIGQDDGEILEYLDLVRTLIRGVERYLEKPFSDDELLLQGLLTHLIPAFNRIRLGLQIRNPMLGQIRTKYEEVYQACRQAVRFVENKLGFSVPEEEIGYIAMHFGAALLRDRDRSRIEYTALVVCASGFGTGQFLASRIRQEISYIEVQEVVSALRVEEWIRLNGEVDLIVSTVPLPQLESMQPLVVSPFLSEDELEQIRGRLNDSSLKQVTRQLEDRHSSDMLLSIAKYGEAISQILRHFRIYERVDSLALPDIMRHVSQLSHVRDEHQLYADLLKREQKGGFVWSGLAMVHARTEGVSELLVSVFRLTGTTKWKGPDGMEHPVGALLMLAAPADAPAEHLETISEISASLIDDEFVRGLCRDPVPDTRAAMEKLLTDNYRLKTEQVRRGF